MADDQSISFDHEEFAREQARRRAEWEAEEDRIRPHWCLPFVQDCLAATLDGMLSNVRQQAIDNASMALHGSRCESPLEWAFHACWGIYKAHPPVELEWPCEFYLRPQVAVGRYRIDFQVAPCHLDDDREFTKFAPIAIELDGHEFHEKTKQQVTRRNQRDRELISAGWTVLRFSGSEFYADPFGCIGQAWRVANKAAKESYYAGHLSPVERW